MPDNSPYDVIVVGAGLAGLTAGYYLSKKGSQVLILEESARAGGMVYSSLKQGYLLEHGPQTVQPKKELIELLSDIGILDQAIYSNPKAPRYIWQQNTLKKVPMGPAELLKTNLLSLKAKVRLLYEPFISAQNINNENIFDFAQRRMGIEVAKNLISPFVSGVWAGDPHLLDIQYSFPQLKNFELNHGSIFKGIAHSLKEKKAPLPKGLLSFPKGLGEIPQKLSTLLKEKIRFNSSVENISFQNDEWALLLKSGETLITKQLIIASPAHKIQGTLQGVSKELSENLKRLEYAAVKVLSLGFDESLFTKNTNGFGFLVAPDEKKSFLGCIFSSHLFPNRAPQGKKLLSLFIGGTTQKDKFNQNEDTLLSDILKNLTDMLGLNGPPEFIHWTRYDKAIPQYNQNYSQVIDTINDIEIKYPTLHFIGNMRGGISVGDVVKTAKERVLSS
ncbi:MAG: protoporphyrinogen oxidase [Elusimicrobiota bacterium]